MKAPDSASSRTLLNALYARCYVGCACNYCVSERLHLAYELSDQIADDECPNRLSRQIDDQEAIEIQTLIMQVYGQD